MNKVAAATLLASLALGAQAVEGKIAGMIVSDRVSLKAGEWFRVSADKGLVAVVPSDGEAITYDVEFQADRGTRPSQSDYADSSATYTAERGLRVLTGRNVGAKIRISVPVKQALEVQLETGLVEIGRLTGKIDARVKTGELDYDARSLPAGICVNASVNEGVVDNTRDFGCRPGEANLHVRTGTIAVK